MIKPTFGHWIFNKVFWFEFADHNLNLADQLGQKPDPKFHTTLKDRVAYVFFLRPWYDIYCRIGYLNGDPIKASIWLNKNLRNPNWRRWLGGSNT